MQRLELLTQCWIDEIGGVVSRLRDSQRVFLTANCQLPTANAFRCPVAILGGPYDVVLVVPCAELDWRVFWQPLGFDRRAPRRRTRARKRADRLPLQAVRPRHDRFFVYA